MPGQLYKGIGVNLMVSAATTGSSGNSSNFKNSSTNFPVCDAAAIILDLTAHTNSGAADTFDVWIQTSPDGGTTWYNAYHWSQMTSVSTSQRRLDIRDTGIGQTEVGAETSIIASNTSAFAVNTVLCEDIRVRWVGGTNFAGATFAVWGIFATTGTRGS